MMSEAPAILAEGLVKTYGKTTALAGLDLTVPAGTVYGLLGPNGAGKTTAVRVFSTLLRPNRGRAQVLGHDVVTEADQVRRKIGLTGQYAALDEYLTGRANLVMIGQLSRLTASAARRRADEMLERFSLTEAAGRAVKTYSGGMRRRLDLAASLIGYPSVLFLDEPTTGLDPNARAMTWDIVRDLAAEGTTLLLTTQYLEEADQLAGRVAVIDGGAVLAEGPPDQLKSSVGGERLEIALAAGADVEAADVRDRHRLPRAIRQPEPGRRDPGLADAAPGTGRARLVGGNASGLRAAGGAPVPPQGARLSRTGGYTCPTAGRWNEFSPERAVVARLRPVAARGPASLRIGRLTDRPGWMCGAGRRAAGTHLVRIRPPGRRPSWRPGRAPRGRPPR
jgi:ABC-2 type transport system ATP-binding protein